MYFATPSIFLKKEQCLKANFDIHLFPYLDHYSHGLQGMSPQLKKTIPYPYFFQAPEPAARYLPAAFPAFTSRCDISLL